eukprot:3936324-Rhodomonas_salina.2
MAAWRSGPTGGWSSPSMQETKTFLPHEGDWRSESGNRERCLIVRVVRARWNSVGEEVGGVKVVDRPGTGNGRR